MRVAALTFLKESSMLEVVFTLSLIFFVLAVLPLYRGR
jgi:hypothetical protein